MGEAVSRILVVEQLLIDLRKDLEEAGVIGKGAHGAPAGAADIERVSKKADDAMSTAEEARERAGDLERRVGTLEADRR